MNPLDIIIAHNRRRKKNSKVKYCYCIHVLRLCNMRPVTMDVYVKDMNEMYEKLNEWNHMYLGVYQFWY